MKDLNMIFAGFGGQGVLFAAKVMAYMGLIENKHISWLPSYGPEMRGGTANCSVCISDDEIGSPLVLSPNVLVAMNLPSLHKFIDDVEPGGLVVVDSSLIDEKVTRDDVTVFYVPATSLAEENEIKGLANMILVGKVQSEIDLAPKEILDQAVIKCVPASKAKMLDFNRLAIEIGRRCPGRAMHS